MDDCGGLAICLFIGLFVTIHVYFARQTGTLHNLNIVRSRQPEFLGSSDIFLSSTFS